MIDLRLEPERLVSHAQMHGHNHNQDEDLGYAVHGWLRAAVGDLSPNVFRLIEQRSGALRLLGYAKSDIGTMQEHAHRFADPLAMNVCDWSNAASKVIGDIAWHPGQALSFELRACPVVRGKQGERDVFLAQLPANGEATPSNRAGVYRGWLSKRLGDAAQLDDDAFRLQAFRLVSTWRQGTRTSGGGRTGRRVVRPDALLSGRLTVKETEAFRHLLHRGLGRHRAFGFGMLLVRPG